MPSVQPSITSTVATPTTAPYAASFSLAQQTPQYVPAKTSAHVDDKPRELTEKEKMAQMLFGGLGMGGGTAPSTGGGRPGGVGSGGMAAWSKQRSTSGGSGSGSPATTTRPASASSLGAKSPALGKGPMSLACLDAFF